MYYVHAPELRRIPTLKRTTLLFEGALSWMDVGLAVLHRLGWSPECSQAQNANIMRALPPAPDKARFYVEREVNKQPSFCTINGREIQMGQVLVVAGAIAVDDIHATVACILLDGRPKVCHGYIHGRNNGNGNPTYLQEVVLLHALRALREWLGAVDHRLIQHIILRAGDGKLCHIIKKWLTEGECGLSSPAASGIIHEIQTKEEWTRVYTTIWPLYLPETFEDPECLSVSVRTFLSMAEHYRMAVLGVQTEAWKQTLPILPYTTEELKTMIENGYKRDEHRVLTQLVALGSQSAAIICRLQLTREVVVEAVQALRDERRAQSNLLDILSASRYKTLAKQGLMDTHCPLQACQQRDSFEHMIQRYDLESERKQGTEAAGFLVRMARKTQILDLTKRRVYTQRE